MTAAAPFATAFAAPAGAARSMPTRSGATRADQHGHARSPVNRAVAGVASGTVTAARFAGHFVAACVSVAVLGTDTDM